ncbi:polyphosphate kinase 1 [Mucilaginibacter sp. KACC 22773]|uniref:polyphosphate kinase 1 n=1 Tax=Mucilaginibacter sp. KACC 22773 TaxID=3025671 RepID=UPI0023661922|nr:polyphosphate kinase 1 [Mucilaginibacter sp. KACC 22773]WDF81006.1 polyphosphate kinase 1 [Mucilaginibacter sp. KACC 22773]
MDHYSFFDRDLSWLLFNERILMEAGKDTLPLMERVNFLSIFSSNLDEFYRVRMPVLLALHNLAKHGNSEKEDVLLEAQELIGHQQQKFGQVFTGEIIALLKAQKITLLFNEPIPNEIADKVSDYFYSQVMAFLQPIDLADTKKNFFPENNRLYFLVTLQAENKTERNVILNIPSNQLPRFYRVNIDDGQYIVFLDDIIRNNLDKLFKNEVLTGCYSIKITRDAELDLDDEYQGDLSEQVEKQLLKRDLGIATRFLHQPGMPLRTLHFITDKFNLQSSSVVEGGMYHNLKDLSGLPVNNSSLRNTQWTPITGYHVNDMGSLFDHIEKQDYIFHAPYQSYDTILRFFNEAATDGSVKEVSVTLYRVASESRIVNALISAAKNGKKVRVMVELKARFDEANNIKWAKKMKAAGVDIIYSNTALKVHAKIALVKRHVDGRDKYSGLLATGNFNESTAAFYTDHIMMTANSSLLREMELLFMFLAKGKKSADGYPIDFKHLLVAQFNLQGRFFELIEQEIANAKQGLPAFITIKLNNLEERTLISKLYEASQAGVKISLIVRSICCLIPGVKGMSENITIRRIVDRYLEHGRIFIFHNNGDEKVFLGSADWMNRNIYRRIEVCFPVYDDNIKAEVLQLIDFQLKDNTQAVALDDKLRNIKIKPAPPMVQSQKAIYEFLKLKLND